MEFSGRKINRITELLSCEQTVILGAMVVLGNPGLAAAADTRLLDLGRSQVWALKSGSVDSLMTDVGNPKNGFPLEPLKILAGGGV